MTINETPPSENEQLREKLRAALATLDTMEVTLAAKEVTLADTRKELAAAQEMLAVTEVTLVAARNLAGSEKHLIEQQQQRQQEQGINVMDLIASVEDEIDSQRDEVKVFAASPAIVKGDSVGLVLVFEKSASATKQTGQAEQKEQAVPSVHDVTYKIWFATCQDVTAKQAEILKRESWKLVYEHVLQDVNDWVDLRSAFAHIAEELPIEEIKLQTVCVLAHVFVSSLSFANSMCMRVRPITW